MTRPNPRSFAERRRRVGAARQPVVNPNWPMLALMFAGVWLGWPWFLLNEYLLESDDFARQARLVLLGLAGSTLLALLILALLDAELLGVREARYAALLLVTWKLGISYVLHNRQERSFSLWEYFGGQPRNGIAVVILGHLLAGPLFERLPFGVLWMVLR